MRMIHHYLIQGVVTEEQINWETEEQIKFRGGMIYLNNQAITIVLFRCSRNSWKVLQMSEYSWASALDSKQGNPV